MWITIYTDASYKKGIASYAYWIRSNHGKIKHTDVIKAKTKDITYAELYAISRAIKHATKSWPGITGIRINCDNLIVGKSLWPWSPKFKDTQLRQLQKNTQNYIKNRKYRVIFKHIKAHQNSKKCSRAWLNNWCDTNAKQTRIKAKRKKND